MLRFALLAVLLTGCSCDDPMPPPRDLGVGDPCTSTDNCRTGLVCADGTCQPSGTGAEGSACVLTGDCASGLFCAASRTCAPAGSGGDGADCESTAECTAGLLCVIEGLGFRCRSAGSGDLGDECTTDRDCLAGLRCGVSLGRRACEDPGVFSGDGGIGPLPILPAWSGETCAMDDGPARAYFALPRDGVDDDFYRLPFPNDARRTAGGLDLSGHPTPGSIVSVDVLGRVIEAAESDLDGFSTNPVVYFRFSKPFDGADLTEDRVLLVNLDPSSPEYGQNLGRRWYWTFGPISHYICPNWMSLSRFHGDPLRAGTTYAAVLLRGVRTSVEEGHTEMARDADLDALLSNTPPAADPQLSAWVAYAPLRTWLALAAAPDAADVLTATVFTTQDPPAMVPAMRSVIRAGAAPVVRDVTVCSASATSPCDDGGLRRCGPENSAYWEIHARIELPQFQAGTPPYETPADGGAIAVDATGAPMVARTEPVCMVMTVPKLSAAPSGGFPLALYAHGTGGAFTAPIGEGLAEAFATQNGGTGAPQAVTVAIDMPLHGSRRGDSTRDPSYLVYNYANPRAARDNLLQGAADLMSLVHWAQSYVLPAAQSPTGFDVSFDGSRIVLFAHSQGATHAQLMVPYEPDISAVLLSGAGGDLTQSLLTKTEPMNISAALPIALLDMDGAGNLAVGDMNPALALIQMFFDRSDPVNFGRHVRTEPIMDTGRHVFMTYGLGDHYSTEATMTAYARSAGLTHVEPQLSDLGLGTPVAAPLRGNVTINALSFTMGLRQYTPPPGEDGHFVSSASVEGRADSLRFLLQALAGSTPQIGN